MESTSILRYLLEIVEARVSPMAKLASLTILNKLCLKESGSTTKMMCVRSDLITSLLTLLDSGLYELRDPSEKVIIMVAMEMLCQFSKLPIDSIQCLVTESVIRTLLEYLNSNGKFRRFPSNAKEVLSKVIEGKQLMGKVKTVSMSTEPLEYIHTHTKHKLKRVPDMVKVCNLINTETEEDLHVTNYLLDNHIGWPGSFPGEIVNETGTDWKNIIVTQVLDGGMFWAQIGEKAIKNVMEIQRHLNNNQVHVKKPRALIGDYVVAYGEILSNPCFFRAQVLSIDAGQADVFAIDYGFTLRISEGQIYVLPDDLGPSKVKRRVSLCAVDGISPPPFDETLCNNAAVILVNLCKQSLPAGELLQKLDGLQIIKRFIEHCPVPKLQAQVITILHNLSSNYRVTEEIKSSGFVKILLDILKGYTEKKPAVDLKQTEKPSLCVSSEDTVLLARCIMCLTNILYRNVETKSQFYNAAGIETILGIVLKVSKKDALYSMSMKLLRIFVGQASSKPTSAELALTPLELLKMHAEAQSDKGLVAQKKSEDRNSLHHIQEDSDNEKDSHEVREPHTRSPSAEHYIYGQEVDICDDETHELFPQRHVQDIDILNFTQHVCGMLNSGLGGKIYFGIDEKSRVFGLELSRDEKDRIRLAVDNHMFRKITPVLFHSQFAFTDIPVLDPQSGQPICDHYVIEISVKPHKGTIYTMSDGQCYYRFGSATSSITRQELRRLIVLEEEAVYSKYIQQLINQREQLLQQLDS